MIFFLLKKIILLFIILYVPKSFSSVSFSDIYLQSYSEKNNIFQNHNEKLGYSLGISLGNYINQSFEKQKKLGIELDKNSLLKGIQDAISGTLKLSQKEIYLTLQELEKKLKHANKIQFEKNAKENSIQGELYMKNFSKLKGVKKTSSGSSVSYRTRRRR